MTETGPRPTPTWVHWLGLLAGPVAWGVQLQAVYTLAAWAGGGGPGWPLHLTSLGCLAAALAGGYLAWRNWRTVGGWPGGSDEADAGRVWLMSVLGMLTAALFSTVIVAQWIAALVLSPQPPMTP